MMKTFNTMSGRWEVADRQQPPRKANPEALAAAEQQRLARRKHLRRELAESAIAEQRRLEFVAAIADETARKDQAASDHVATCAPLQAELKELEERQIEAIVARQPADPQNESRRAELLAELQRLNTNLQDAIASHDRTLAQLEQKRLEQAQRCATSTLESELMQTASIEAQSKLHVAACAVRWALARFDASQARSHCPQTDAERQAAAQAAEEAEKAQRAAVRLCIDEE